MMAAGNFESSKSYPLTFSLIQAIWNARVGSTGEASWFKHHEARSRRVDVVPHLTAREG